jgi:hypothetical protein
VLRSRIRIEEYAALSSGDDRAELVEAPESRIRAARGAITGVLLGMGLWVTILILVGVIKL